MIILNKENNQKVRIKVRLTEEENEELNAMQKPADCHNRSLSVSFAKGKHRSQNQLKSFGNC